MLALILSRVLTPREAFAGFGDPVVVLIAAIFIVGEALVNTGVVHRLGEAVMRVRRRQRNPLDCADHDARGSNRRVYEPSAIVAMFIPLVLTVARKRA